MSDYCTYYFKAALNARFDDVEDFRTKAAAKDVYFDLQSTPMPLSDSAPSFGPGTDYVGQRFSFWGIDIAEGVLSIGVFGTNFERKDVTEEDDDGIERPVGGSRLERLLGFLSEVTDGEAGEIQGAYSAERYDYERHADPIVRCPDGRLRVCTTPVTRHDDGHGIWGGGDETPDIEIPDLLPADLVPSGIHRARVELDMKALLARFQPVEIQKTPMIGQPR